jgi:hypothetical protein
MSADHILAHALSWTGLFLSVGLIATIVFALV